MYCCRLVSKTCTFVTLFGKLRYFMIIEFVRDFIKSVGGKPIKKDYGPSIYILE